MLEEPGFAVESAAISGEGTIGADDAVAGDHDSDGIGTVGEADCSYRSGLADFSCELQVGNCGAAGDGSQGAPDFALEGSAGGFDWQRANCG